MLNISILCLFSCVCTFLLFSEFKRKSEFRRICEALRLHQQQARVSAIMSAGTDSVSRVIDTRIVQMNVAIDLGLWSVAFQTVDEMHTLFSKKRPTNSQLLGYYSSLANILYQSANSQQHQLFHAACLIKSFHLFPNQAAADSAALAVLASTVPSELVAAPVDESLEFVAEKIARLSVLCGGVPTRQSLMSDLVAKDVVSSCSPGVAAVFVSCTNGRFETPVSESVCGKYTGAIRRVALVGITRNMASLYSCIGFEKFMQLVGEFTSSLNEAIKLLAQLKRADQLDVLIDYGLETISFGSPPSCTSFVVSKIAHKLRCEREEDRIVAAAEALFDEDVFAERLEAERLASETRREATQARKEALEQAAVRKAQDLIDQIQKAEEERLESDANARAAELARKEAEEATKREELAKAKLVVERIVATGGPIAVEAASWTDEQLILMGTVALGRKHKGQIASERLDRINKRRNESKRLEYTARLLRGAENQKIRQWEQTIYEQDRNVFAQIAAERAEEWHKAAASKQAAVNALVPFANVLSSWKKDKTDEFNAKWTAKVEEDRKKISPQPSPVQSSVAPISTMSRDEFKEMAKSLPDWKDSTEQQ